jgi:hypothetical protein
MSSNSDAVKQKIKLLRAGIRSRKGKIERRNTAILFAQRDIREHLVAIRVAKQMIVELGGKVK